MDNENTNDKPEPIVRKPDGGDVTGGFQPSKNEGDNPANKPPPKKP